MLLLTLAVAVLSVAPCFLPEERAAFFPGEPHVDVIRMPR